MDDLSFDTRDLQSRVITKEFLNQWKDGFFAST